MTKQEAIDLIKARLGSREDSDLDVLIAAELQVSQEILEALPPYFWFLQQEDAGRQLTIDDPKLALPSDFVIEIEDQVIEISTDQITWVELTKASYDDIRAEFRNSDAAQPSHYALLADDLYFGPKPDQAYYIRWNYSGRDTAISGLAAGATNIWLTKASDILTAHAGISVASWVKDSAAMQLFAGKYTEAKQRLEILHEARMEVNHNRRSES